MADPTIQPPYLDPSQYPAYADMQRKQMAAQVLMSALQQSSNSPNPVGAPVGAYQVQAKRGIMQDIAPILTAALAGKANRTAMQAQQNYMNPQQPAATAPYDSAAAAQAPSGIAQPAPGPGSSTATSGLVQAPPQNPMVPAGMQPRTAQGFLNMLGPQEYAKKMLELQTQRPDIVSTLRAANIDPNSPQGLSIQRQMIMKPLTPELAQQLHAAGIDPDSPQGQQIQQQSIAKATNIPPTAVRANETVLDPLTHQPFFTGPDNGLSTTWNNGQPRQSNIPGALPAERAAAAAKTAGTQSQMPIELGTDENGKKIFGFASPPGASGGPGSGAASAPINATAPGTTASPANVTAQQRGAEASQNYSTELAKNAEGALELRRGVSELRGLAQDASPSAMNSAKLKMGNWMIASGMKAKTVSDMLGVDVPALQASEHTQGGLAVSAIHGMTSRGTNFDLETFMRQNPNLDMNSPEAFNRVADFMDNKAQQTIAKQADFAKGGDWKKGVKPQDLEAAHTAHWNDLQNQLIDQGKFRTSSTPAARPGQSSGGPSPADLKAEMIRRGLIKAQ